MIEDYSPEIAYCMADSEMITANIVFYSNLLILYSLVIIFVLILVIALLTRELLKK